MTRLFQSNVRRPFGVVCGVTACLLLVACGGADTAGESRLSQTLIYSKQSNANDVSQTEPSSDRSPGSAARPSTRPSNNSGAERLETGGDQRASRVFDEALWGRPAVRVTGPVTLEWFAPEERENGDALAEHEIGGYELRYRREGAPNVESRVLKTDSTELEVAVFEGDWEVTSELRDLHGDYQFVVAAFDVDGLYSNFVNITPES